MERKLKEEVYFRVITENDNVMSAYDVCKFIYEKAKNIDVFREMNDDFFYMMDRGFPKQEQKETEKVV